VSGLCRAADPQCRRQRAFAPSEDDLHRGHVQGRDFQHSEESRKVPAVRIAIGFGAMDRGWRREAARWGRARERAPVEVRAMRRHAALAFFRDNGARARQGDIHKCHLGWVSAAASVLLDVG
jgi:hypothetical protein